MRSSVALLGQKLCKFCFCVLSSEPTVSKQKHIEYSSSRSQQYHYWWKCRSSLNLRHAKVKQQQQQQQQQLHYLSKSVARSITSKFHGIVSQQRLLVFLCE
ncbi:hypothetical protein T01_3961 [Trichinella spiralis]|uniref:Uncharacterized protein n=1 Tax=Trichinella spiralis TaxID=6334 RepID=A0A0V1BDQ1_TRISP|nr:hypothetical protein T01_3961 [Trichinella spiralis]